MAARSVGVIGGGPAGLFSARLLALSRPDWKVTVYERLPPDDTFGFGVVFSDQTLDIFARYDPESHQAILENFSYWDDIETTVGHKLDAKHPVPAWMLRHTGWLHTRFQRHAADGRTSFEKLRLRRYVSPLVTVGESVHCKRPGKQLRNIDNQWATGLWLGRVNSTDENTAATKDGIVLSRSIRRRPVGEHWTGKAC